MRHILSRRAVLRPTIAATTKQEHDMTDTEVVVIGAGVAGLAAAATLRAAGRPCVLIEAAARPGGRAFTARPAALAGAWLDLGATWLHDADRNPLAALARTTGDTLIDADRPRTRRLQVGATVLSAAEEADFAAAHARIEAALSGRATAGPDIAFAAAMDPYRADPWAATVELWEAAQIAAADPARLSLRDWHRNLLEGRNLIVDGGIGAFVARRLAALAGPVELDTRATAIDWSDTIRVATPRGTVTARAAIVTVSTGVLATLNFRPSLPAATAAAIDALPMGLLTKTAFALADPLALPDSISLRRRVVPGEPAMSFMVRPYGQPYVQGFIGGPTAWALAKAGPAATEDFARAQWRILLGEGADRALGQAVISAWGTDPWHRGGYAYATAGSPDPRAALATPIADGRLAFAGEATCTDGLAGTVGGAHRAGTAAARTILATLPP
jgi:monoamine oxidase